MNKIVLSVAALAASGMAMAAAPTLVTAPAPTTSHWYVGVGLNYNAVQKDKHWWGEPDNYDELDLAKHRWGYNLFVGNRLTTHFANEFGFSEVGDATWHYKDYEINEEVTVEHEATFDVKDIYHVYYDGLFFMPLNQSVEVFAMGGLSYLWSKGDITFHNDGDSIYEHHDAKLETFALNYGGGVQFNWRQFALRGRYMRVVPSHDMDDWHQIIDTVNIDALYHLG
jgi:opacity protein-like surface antigen